MFDVTISLCGFLDSRNPERLNVQMSLQEPPWVEGSHCMECGVKFGVATRKHHCRHCGRLLCAKCSSRLIPIIKFDVSKPTRVCDLCYDVLTLGGTH